MKPIVSFDIDMTLLDHKIWDIPKSAKEALLRLRRDYLIVVASGRDMDHKNSAKLRDEIRPDAIIHMNGTKVTVGDKQIYSHLFDKNLLKELLAFAQERGHSIGASINGVDYFTGQDKVIAHDRWLWGCSDRHFGDPWILMEEPMPVRTLAYIGGEEGAKEIEARFPKLKLPMFEGKCGADVVEIEASKAEGLKRLCSYYGTPLSETVAFGDSMNDYEIIREAGIGIAMGNAIAELKEAADYVTTNIDEDGIWNACVHLKLFKS